MNKSWLLTSFLLLGFALPSLSAAADMQYPLSIAAAGDGTVYVAGRYLPGIWVLTEGQRRAFFTGSKTVRTPLNAVRCVAVDARGRVVAGDTSTREIYRFDADGKPQPLTKGKIGMPMAVAFDRAGNILACDLEAHRVVKVPEAGGEPVIVAEITAPRGIAVDGKDRIWVVSHGKDQLLRIASEGKVETVIAGKPLQFPNAVALDRDANAYLCDGYAKSIVKVSPDSKPVTLVEGAPLKGPVGIAWHKGRLLVADPQAVKVFSLSLDGKLTPLE